MPVNACETLTVGTSAVAWDPTSRYYAGQAKVHTKQIVKNRGNTGIGVNEWGTAVIDGPDTEYIPPGGYGIYSMKTLSIISDASGGKVEVGGNGGRT